MSRGRLDDRLVKLSLRCSCVSVAFPSREGALAALGLLFSTFYMADPVSESGVMSTLNEELTGATDLQVLHPFLDLGLPVLFLRLEDDGVPESDMVQ